MNKLKLLRKEKNISQKNISKDLKISQINYSRYETEKRAIPLNKLKDFANYFKVSIDYLLGLTQIKCEYKPSKIFHTNYNMNRLKEIREDRDLIQEDIGKVLDMSRNGYAEYETGAKNIPVYKLIKLAIYYNVPIDYILYLTDERVPHKRK